MSEPYLGEIRPMGFNFAPRGWALCDGQILSINQNQSLYSLLGTMYGGDGRTTFALPDLRGRTPIHSDSGSIQQAAKGGQETVTLTMAQIPPHSHTAQVSADTGTAPIPAANLPAASNNLYGTAQPTTALQAGTLGNAGDGQPHNNMQPSLTINYVIAIQGLFPPRS